MINKKFAGHISGNPEFDAIHIGSSASLPFDEKPAQDVPGTMIDETVIDTPEAIAEAPETVIDEAVIEEAPKRTTKKSKA